jgi:hypothetical protein
VALERKFEQIPWQLFRRKSLQFPCIFPCYREFAREGFAHDWILRHTVCTAEKFRQIPPKMARTRRNSAIHPLKPDQRKRPAKCDKAALHAFLWTAETQSGFEEDQGAKARRSRTIDWYEIMEVLPTIASDKKSERSIDGQELWAATTTVGVAPRL